MIDWVPCNDSHTTQHDVRASIDLLRDRVPEVPPTFRHALYAARSSTSNHKARETTAPVTIGRVSAPKEGGASAGGPSGAASPDHAADPAALVPIAPAGSQQMALPGLAPSPPASPIPACADCQSCEWAGGAARTRAFASCWTLAASAGRWCIVAAVVAC